MTVDQWSDTMPLAITSLHIKRVYTKQSHVSLLEVLQQIRERMEAIAKGIVSDP